MADPNYHTWRGFRADPENLPLARPGVYLIRHIASGKAYVGISGNVARRLMEHSERRDQRVSKAIRKHGQGRFHITPLFYSTTGTGCLPQVEADLIRQLNTVWPHGYNVAESDGIVGPYGTVFSELMRTKGLAEWAAEPSRRETMSRRMSAQWADPEYRARRTQGIRAHTSTPEHRTRAAETAARLWADPAHHSFMRAISKAKMADPEARMRLSRANAADPAAFRARRSEQAKAQWADPAARARKSEQAKAFTSEPAERTRMSKRAKEVAADPAERERRAERMKARWADPAYRAWQSERMKAAMADPVERARKSEQAKASDQYSQYNKADK